MPKNLYSEQDDEFLRANYLEMSNAVLAEHLGHTVRSVEKRLLSVLGLKRTQQDMGRIRRKEEDTRNKAEREKHRGQVPDEWFDLPASRTAAQEAIDSKYFDGKTCDKGHLDLRFANGGCIPCTLDADKERQADPERMTARSAWRKTYRKRDDVREYENDLRRERMKDPTFKYRANMSSRISVAMRANKISKPAESEKLMGTTWAEFRKWIDSQLKEGMTPENYGEWHLDHVRPCASFDLAEEAQCFVAFNWRNYQPMWGLENIEKNDDYEPHHEVEWARRMRELRYDGELFLLFEEGRGGL